MIERLFAIIIVLVFCLGVSAGDTGRDYWVSRYLSVSYPLKNISVNSPYGNRKDPLTGKQSFHDGLDLRAQYEDVYAMFDGVVERIGSNNRSGNFVIIRHGVYTVSYCHLSRRYVEEGDEVLAGLPIGVSGCTGRATGAHLHLTVKRDGNVTDPNILLEYIGAVRSQCYKALGVVDKELSAPLMSQREFVKHYSSMAMEQQVRYGIPASVTLAQMAYESDWGRSALARHGKNYFGIKCTPSWLSQGKPYSLHDDDRKNEKFCNYGSVKESVEHHSRLLMGDRYRKCRRCKPTDYHGWLTALKEAGYATARQYVAECEKIIRQYKLYEYDQMAVNS